MNEKTKSFLYILLNIVITLSIILVLALIILIYDLPKKINLDNLTNDYCQTMINSKNSLNNLICDNKYKKEKIIILFVDGLAFDQLHFLKNISNYNLTNFYKIKGAEYKQTG